MCVCQLPWIPPNCLITHFEYFQSWPSFHSRWAFFGVAVLFLLAAIFLGAQHVLVDRRHSKLLKSTKLHLVGLFLVALSAVCWCLQYAMNPEGIYTGGYQGNFGWVFVKWVLGFLTLALAVMNASLITGIWLMVSLGVMFGFYRCRCLEDSIAYLLLLISGLIFVPLAFFFAYYQTVTPCYRYYLLLGSSFVAVLFIFLCIATVTVLRGARSTLSMLGNVHLQQRKMQLMRLLRRTIASVLGCFFVAVASTVLAFIPDSAYLGVQSNFWALQYFLPFILQCFFWVFVMAFHIRADWKTKLAEGKFSSNDTSSTEQKIEEDWEASTVVCSKPRSRSK